MKKEKDRSHLGIEDRVEIAAGLDERRTATEIASRIVCAKTTVSREVKGHCSVERKGAYGRSFNDCARRTVCKVEIMRCFLYSHEKYCFILIKKVHTPDVVSMAFKII